MLLTAGALAIGGEADHMFEMTNGKPSVLNGTHHCIYRGEKDVNGYNNHVYLARYADRFWAMWSCASRDGGHTGQYVRFATSVNGTDWSSPGTIALPPEDGYLIARGLWVRDGKLLALVARCSGETVKTKVEALEAYQWDPAASAWKAAGTIGKELINNYAPIRLETGEWLMPYRFRELNRVDGVLVGGKSALDSWRRIPFPGPEEARFTEANAVIRKDGTVAVHFRDNHRSGFLFRSVSKDGGKSFSQPTKTDFPDCKCKHFCMKLSTGTYVLINNPESRSSLQVSASGDGVVFSRTAILRDRPPAVRNAGHDKGPSFTYPHACEHDGFLYIAYSVSRDDIWLTRISVKDIDRQLGEQATGQQDKSSVRGKPRR